MVGVTARGGCHNAIRGGPTGRWLDTCGPGGAAVGSLAGMSLSLAAALSS